MVMFRVAVQAGVKNDKMEIPYLTPVNSSNIDVVGYDSFTEDLFIGFKGQVGKMWRYSGVSKKVYDALMGSESIGAYYAKNIKPVYPGVQLHNMQGHWKMLK